MKNKKYTLVEYNTNSLVGDVVFESLSKLAVQEMKNEYESQVLNGKRYKIEVR